MATYNNSVVVKFDTKENGNSASGASITVYYAGTDSKADITHDGSDPTANPLFADSNGNYSFEVDDGFYDIIINEGFLSEERIENQQIATIISFDSATGHYDNLQDAIASPIEVGEVITTAGYYTANDGGAGQYIVVAGGTGTDDGGSYLDMTNGNQLELIENFKGVNILNFGAGNYPSDATDAINSAAIYANSINQNLQAPKGIYSISQIDLPSGVGIIGEGAPIINTWFNEVGDKPFLRPTYKDKISGTTFLLTGTPTYAYVTNRTDKFSSILYGIKYTNVKAALFRDFGVVMDMDVYNLAGDLTTSATDNRSGHENGFLIRSPLTKCYGLNVFGYYEKGGFLVHSQEDLETIDTDYVRVFQSDICSTVLIANNNADTQGLTGARFTDCGFYNAADHHNATIGGDGDYTLNSIYIDGNNGIDGIRGHSFSGNLRTRANNAISLDQCNDISFDIASETPTLAGVPNADAQGNIIGTSNTGNIRILNVAQSSVNGLGINGFAETIGGCLISLGGETNEEVIVSKSGNSVRLIGGVDGVIQITDDLDSDSSKWTILKDTSNSQIMSIRYDNVEVLRLQADGKVRARDALIVDNGIDLTGSIIYSTEGDIRGTGAGVRLREGSSTALLSDLTRTRPGGDNVQDLGGTSTFWKNVYSHGLILKSPNGTQYKVTVDDAGNLLTTAV